MTSKAKEKKLTNLFKRIETREGEIVANFVREHLDVTNITEESVDRQVRAGQKVVEQMMYEAAKNDRGFY